MEIDGAPGHLDMDGLLARRAVAAGVTVVVDSDCHRVEALARQMQFGVGTARRGWLEPRHVLQHSRRRRGPGVRGEKAKAWLNASRSRQLLPPWRSGPTRRRCCQGSILAIQAGSRPRSSGLK